MKELLRTLYDMIMLSHFEGDVTVHLHICAISFFFFLAPTENVTLGSQKMAGAILWQSVMAFMKPKLVMDKRFSSIGEWGLKQLLSSEDVGEINLNFEINKFI